jgi:hypothetical protein
MGSRKYNEESCIVCTVVHIVKDASIGRACDTLVGGEKLILCFSGES